jgi:hypothetical protein
MPLPERWRWGNPSGHALTFVEGAATALLVERICIWLARMAELGAAVAYHKELAQVRARVVPLHAITTRRPTP